MATTAEIERVEAKIIAQKGAKSCDKYDYLTAVGCGVVAGLVDSFFVGMPGESKLGGWTDAQVDKAVMNFAKICGWTPHAGKENSVSSAIGFLERNFRVNYDQKNSVEAGTPFKMSPSNHHMKSLAHSPDIVGLFFSILNQFTGTATYLDNGRFITIQTDTYELQGNDFISKLFCGTVNWLGHLMSDVAGSSGGRGKNNGGRGSGIVIPFYELFGLCNFGSFQVGKDRNTLAILATKAFQKGYDARWGLTMAIPVVLCDLSIRFIWAVRRYFGDKKPLQECIPSEKYPDLRMMLLIGNGSLCFVDAIDAAVRSGGNALTFFLHLNLIAWYKLVKRVLAELLIRYDLSYADLAIYMQKINQELERQLQRLRQIDYAAYEKELAQINDTRGLLGETTTDTDAIYRKLDEMGVSMQFHSSKEFDEKMMDDTFVLEL